MYNKTTQDGFKYGSTLTAFIRGIYSFITFSIVHFSSVPHYYQYVLTNRIIVDLYFEDPMCVWQLWTIYGLYGINRGVLDCIVLQGAL